MASNSKKRRRVLRVSCILAALIIAGSSFAWFTSKDEVTNRLTANADYGVSIVESFTPPANWLPGQTVNKDVYAVNTGNVDAFVKENITGKLNYTYEQAVDAFDEDCVLLAPAEVTAIDGATTEEAGGYLAWTNAKVDDGNGGEVTYPTGPINSRRQDPDGTDTGTEDPRWTPPATGVYIFRRAIDTTGVNILDDEIPTFTYAGYYFVKGATADEDKYYEIVIGNDSHPTDGTETYPASTEPGYAAWNFDTEVSSGANGAGGALGAGVTVDKDGVITGEPRIRYVKEYQVENADAVFTYDAGDAATSTPATLTVNYVPDLVGTGDVAAAKQALDDAEAALTAAEQAKEDLDTAALTYESDAAKAETDYENALGEYNTKLSRYNQTLADYNYAKDIADATNALYNAADARAVFQAQLDAAKQAMDDAWNDDNGTPTDATDDSGVVPKATSMVDPDGTYKDVIAMKDDNSAISFKNLFDITEKEETTGATDNTLGGRINYLYDTYGNGLNDGTGRFGSVKKNMDTMYDLWVDIKALLDGGTMTDGTVIAADQGIIDDLTTLKNGTSGTMTSTQVAAIRERLNTNLGKLKTAATNYKNAYAALKAATGEGLNQEATLTNILQNNDKSATVNATAGKAVDLYDVEFKTADTGLEALMKDYENKYDTWETMNDETHPTQDGTLGKANADWYAAVDTYNTALDTALGDANTAGSYLYDVNQTQPELNGFDRLTGSQGAYKLTNQSALIIPDYAATNTSNGKFGVTTGNAATYPDYKDYTISTGVAPEVTPATDPATYAVPDYDATDAANTGKERKTYSTDTFTQVDVTGGKTLDTLETEKDNAYNTVYGEGGTDANPIAGSKKELYDTAVSKRDNVATAKAEAQAAVVAAQAAVTDAEDAYNQALGNASPVKIIINLADAAENMGWTYDAVNTDEGKEANFYLNKVLAAGETSDKLIDSVYLDAYTRAKAYKSLVFDLNVGMDSVQVTYDANQREYATDAVTPENGFNMTATTTAGSDAVSWS